MPAGLVILVCVAKMNESAATIPPADISGRCFLDLEPSCTSFQNTSYSVQLWSTSCQSRNAVVTNIMNITIFEENTSRTCLLHFLHSSFAGCYTTSAFCGKRRKSADDYYSISKKLLHVCLLTIYTKVTSLKFKMYLFILSFSEIKI